MRIKLSEQIFNKYLITSLSSFIVLYGAYQFYFTYVFKKLNKMSYDLYQLKHKIYKQKNKTKALIPLVAIDSMKCILKNPMKYQYYSQCFLVQNLENKEKIKDIQKTENPFLAPFEKGIFITQLSDTHNLLFNKFPLQFEHIIQQDKRKIDRNQFGQLDLGWTKLNSLHLLITTQKYQQQSQLLDLQDFQAIYKVMKAIDGFVYYNSGPMAGASQKHKHIQILQKKSVENLGGYLLAKQKIKKMINEQMENEIKENIHFQNANRNQKINEYSFVHSFKLLPQIKDDELENNVLYEKVHQLYLQSLEECQILDANRSLTDYNLLMTQKLMILVPRKSEYILQKFSVNAMFFLGSFITKNKNDFEYLKSFYFEDLYQDAVFFHNEELKQFLTQNDYSNNSDSLDL